MAAETKNERITTRVSAQVKDKLLHAAGVVDATLNQFLIQAALEKAELIIQNERKMNLSLTDSSVFFDALENPPEPNEKLKKAAASFKEMMG